MHMQAHNWLKTFSVRMYRLPIHLGIGFLMLLLVSCQSHNNSTVASSAEGMQSFESSVYDFSIDYPASWFAKELPDGNHGDKEVVAMFFVLGPFPGALVQQKELANPTLENVANWGEQRILNRYDEYDLGELIKANYSEQEVLERTYRANMTTGSDIMLRDVYLLYEDKGFILTFISYTNKFDELNLTFQSMIDSFQFHDIEDE